MIEASARQCWFCERREADPQATYMARYAFPLNGVEGTPITSTKGEGFEHRTLPVPRCPRCRSKHRIEQVLGGAVGITIVGTTALVLILYLLGLRLHSALWPLIFIGLPVFYLGFWRLMRTKEVGLVDQKYPPALELQKSGWIPE